MREHKDMMARFIDNDYEINGVELIIDEWFYQ